MPELVSSLDDDIRMQQNSPWPNLDEKLTHTIDRGSRDRGIVKEDVRVPFSDTTRGYTGGSVIMTPGCGIGVGINVGSGVGTSVGTKVGTEVGIKVGTVVGTRLGTADGIRVGIKLGTGVG